MTHFILLTFCLFMLLNCSASLTEKQPPALIPLPEHVTWLEDHFRLSPKTVVVDLSEKPSPYFKEHLQKLCGIVVKSGHLTSSNNSILLTIDTQLDSTKSEAYTLHVSKQQVRITGASEAGLFRGMQTFFQLIPPQAKVTKNADSIEIPGCDIRDKPQFQWRGLNLDCGRHFMSKDFIKRYIDILAYYKFNRLHWHLTEDQGWRIEIKKYPKLTEIGAWRKEADGSIYGGFYTQEDIREIVAYAEERFITIVPEIEMPGHSLASLASYPENSCTGGPFEVGTIWGVMKDIYCAGRDSTFYFLQDILDEVTTLFPSQYIHIGGDEAPKDRWKACSACQARIKNEGLLDEHELQSYFIKRIAKYLHSKKRQVIGWDEILEGGLAPGAIVQSWRSMQGAVDAAKLGHYAISSPTSHTYLNHDPEDLDVRIAYAFQPVPDQLTGEERKFILGGEANLWTEHAPQETVDSKLFPRLLALAEVFWNDPHNKNYNAFYTRLQTAYNDLEALGIQYGRETKVITPATSWDADAKVFVVTIKKGQKDANIRYTVNGSEPDTQSPLYTKPVKINSTTALKIAAFKNDQFIGSRFTMTFVFHQALGANIRLTNPYDERYRAGGKNALIDGIRGSNDLHDGMWQGFEGVDFEAVIDLGMEKEISKIAPTFLLDANSWVFLPEKVTIAIAKQADHFFDEIVLENDIPQKNSEIIAKDFTAHFDKRKARYIRIHAENIKKCPAWHPGAGGPAWLFIDEIVVE